MIFIYYCYITYLNVHTVCKGWYKNDSSVYTSVLKSWFGMILVQKGKKTNHVFKKFKNQNCRC